VFRRGTLDPAVYNHAYDAWNNVKHSQYNEAVERLLREYSGGRQIGETRAKQFLKWIAEGKCTDKEFAKQFAKLWKTVFDWRKGFLQSIAVAEAAKQANRALTAEELKAIARKAVNGENVALSRRAARVYRTLAASKSLLLHGAKKIVPGVLVFSFSSAAKRGWAGEGQVGSGVVGATAEMARELVMADLVEGMVFPAIVAGADTVEDVVIPGGSLEVGGKLHMRKKYGGVTPDGQFR